MTVVHERVFIEAPFVQAAGAFERRLGIAHGTAEGRCTLALVAPIPDDHGVVREVSAEVTLVAPAANYAVSYRIGWPAGTTEHGLPTPGFEGTIRLSAGETYDECEVRLDGEYDPPAGLVGALFDGIVGRRLAHATLGSLLEGVRAELRSDHERVEAEKSAR